MEVLNSRVLLRPTDPERSRAFYRDTLGLAIYREFGDGPEGGTVFFLGGGFLELSGRAAEPPAPGMALWLQVRDLAATRQELGERGVGILREPRREPWGCGVTAGSRRYCPPCDPEAHLHWPQERVDEWVRQLRAPAEARRAARLRHHAEVAAGVGDADREWDLAFPQLAYGAAAQA